jgi:hypothetical protein
VDKRETKPEKSGSARDNNKAWRQEERGKKKRNAMGAVGGLYY